MSFRERERHRLRDRQGKKVRETDFCNQMRLFGYSAISVTHCGVQTCLREKQPPDLRERRTCQVTCESDQTELQDSTPTLVWPLLLLLPAGWMPSPGLTIARDSFERTPQFPINEYLGCPHLPWPTMLLRKSCIFHTWENILG